LPLRLVLLMQRMEQAQPCPLSHSIRCRHHLASSLCLKELLWVAMLMVVLQVRLGSLLWGDETGVGLA
jgi:hypothetical protein